MFLSGRSILLVIGGGIAAYKSLEFIRLLRKAGAQVDAILTAGGQKFITPLSVSSLTGRPTYTDLWSLKDEVEMGHIRLARAADVIMVAPASANLIARLAHGLADDLAAATILARGQTPLIVAPAMNPAMWENAATQDNLKILAARGVTVIPPTSGDMACGEVGLGRLPEPAELLKSLEGVLSQDQPLKGFKAVVTAGPTFESIDPVRFIGNKSSGKQGYAIARALERRGAEVVLISGPSALPTPDRIKTIRVDNTQEMFESCCSNLPFDIGVMAAAVADWTVDQAPQKIKKNNNDTGLTITFRQTPDILKTLSTMKNGRPRLMVGFAAETQNILSTATEKRVSKGCDWLVVNPIDSENPVFGQDENKVYVIDENGVEDWPKAQKDFIAEKLADRIVTFFAAQEKP